MTLQEFYDALDRHDWHYSMTENFSEYRRGNAERNRLMTASGASVDHMNLFYAFRDWSIGAGNKPERPRS